jgi:glycosyltransferase involved in cell wall biosynthesis
MRFSLCGRKPGAQFQSERNKGMVLAVIPCLNEAAHLESLVTRLIATTNELPLRVVISDGGSIDGTQEIAQKLTGRFGNVFLLDNPKRLQGAAVNLAVSLYGEHEHYLIRIDAHADYPADFCRVLVEEAEITKADSVVVAMKTVGKGRFQRAIAVAQNSRIGNGGSAHRRDGGVDRWVDHGHHALMRIAAFRAVGGYDEHFSHNEDAELDIRLKRAGFSIWLTRKTGIAYYPRATPAALFSQYFSYGQGRALTLLKHGLSPKLRQLVSAMVLPAALLAFACPLFWPAAVPLSAWAVFCLCYGFFLAIKSRESGNILSGAAALVMHAGWSLGFWSRILSHGPRAAVGGSSGPSYLSKGY